MELKKETCYIFGAGDYTGIALKQEIDGFIIAADGGFLFLQQNKIKPNLLMGDFDSLELKSSDFLPAEDCIMRHPPEKDDTDMMLAVKEGFRRGYGEFVIMGGLGGRTDHTIANIQTLSYIAREGGRGYLIGNGEIMTVIADGEITIPVSKQNGKYISVFCLGNEATGVDIKNLKYELVDGELTNRFPLGVSNEFTNQPAYIKVSCGSLLIIWQNSFGEEEK